MWRWIKRIFRHLWADEATTRRAIAPDVLQRLQQRVTASERRHSGEIRIYVEAGLPLSYLLKETATPELTRRRALSIFGKLKVWDTANNNGVLIYLLLAEHTIEIVADRGLSQAVNPQVWQEMVKRMSHAFKRDKFEEGLTHALEEVSALLVCYFPLAAGDANPNELPDQPVLN